jgi:serine/threonine-protein kinase RsbW
MSAWWRSWAAAAGLPADVCDRGELCLNEAVGNIIEHGGTNADQIPVEIALDRSTTEVQITVIDSTAPFNPLEHEEAQAASTVESPPARGRGIQLMRAFANGILYRRKGNQNVLTFSFRW